MRANNRQLIPMNSPTLSKPSPASSPGFKLSLTCKIKHVNEHAAAANYSFKFSFTLVEASRKGGLPYKVVSCILANFVIVWSKVKILDSCQDTSYPFKKLCY